MSFKYSTCPHREYCGGDRNILVKKSISGV
jgi:hypothetical protein